MSFSYDADEISTVPLYWVRMWLDDIVEATAKFPDESINALLATGSKSAAVAALADILAVRFASKPDVGNGDLRISWSQVSKRYSELALQFRTNPPGDALAIPRVGGGSREQNLRMRQDTDRIPPENRDRQYRNREARTGTYAYDDTEEPYVSEE